MSIDAFRIAIIPALETHRPCKASGVLEALETLLWGLKGLGVRSPNDWCPEYTGYVTLRWYDGEGDHLSGSKSNVQIAVLPDELRISGKIGTKKASYSSGDGFSIPCLDHDAAMSILPVLIEMIDRSAK